MPAVPRSAPERVLLGLLGLVAAYAVAMVVAGRTVDRLFDLLGFGSGDAGVPAGPPMEHVLLVQGVLGAVILGWAVLLAAVVHLGLRSGDPRSWWALVASIGTWFVVDTGFSLVVGSWQHALFNVPFALMLGVPLALARPRSARPSA
jgi:predicted phage tail protein